jgi:hypothetical protein
MNAKGRAHLDAITAITAQEEPAGVATLTGAPKPILGHIRGITAPIGTLLGPNGEGQWFVIDGYDDGVARIGLADNGQIAAAVSRAKDGEFYSLQEFKHMKRLREREVAATNARLRTLRHG